MLHIQQLSKKYKGAEYYSVSNLDLDIEEGEIFGILGPNGAGKTTLISMLCSLIKPSSGIFTINNLNYSNNKQELKQLIGIVPQEYALYPSLTAYENLSYFGSMYSLQGKALKESIHLYLEKMGLLEFANKKIEVFFRRNET